MKVRTKLGHISQMNGLCVRFISLKYKSTVVFYKKDRDGYLKPWSHQAYVRRAGCLRAVYGIAGSPCGCLKEPASTVEVVQSKISGRGPLERFANMFANQSTVRNLPTDIC